MAVVLENRVANSVFWGGFVTVTVVLQPLFSEFGMCCVANVWDLTLAELHVIVLTSFIKLIKLLQNLMKLLLNHIMI